jgi:hypothetical protein
MTDPTHPAESDAGGHNDRAERERDVLRELLELTGRPGSGGPPDPLRAGPARGQEADELPRAAPPGEDGN